MAAAPYTTLLYASLAAYGDSSTSELRALTSHDEVNVATPAEFGDAKVANREIRVWHGATEEGP